MRFIRTLYYIRMTPEPKGVLPNLFFFTNIQTTLNLVIFRTVHNFNIVNSNVKKCLLDCINTINDLRLVDFLVVQLDKCLQC